MWILQERRQSAVATTWLKEKVFLKYQVKSQVGIIPNDKSIAHMEGNAPSLPRSLTLTRK